MNVQDDPIPSGGGGQTAPMSPAPQVSIDATDMKDQGLLRRAMKEWPARWRSITPEKKDKWLADLERAKDAALGHVTANEPEVALKAVAGVVSATKTLVAMEAQNQADEHLERGQTMKVEHSGEVTEIRRVEIELRGLSDEQQQVMRVLTAGPAPQTRQIESEVVDRATDNP